MGEFVLTLPDGSKLPIKVQIRGEGRIVNPGDPDWVDHTKEEEVDGN